MRNLKTWLLYVCQVCSKVQTEEIKSGCYIAHVRFAILGFVDHKLSRSIVSMAESDVELERPAESEDTFFVDE